MVRAAFDPQAERALLLCLRFYLPPMSRRNDGREQGLYTKMSSV